jgi:hypothetical protein
MPAIKAANTKLEAVGIAPIGRATFRSVRRFTLRVYSQATERRDRLRGRTCGPTIGHLNGHK